MAFPCITVPIRTTTSRSFALAEDARRAEMHGRFTEAMALFAQAIESWTPDQAPKGQDGQPELWWPELWRGSLITLDSFPIHLFRDAALPSLPLCSLTL